MTNADPRPSAGPSDDERRQVRRLVSALRARGGLGAVAAACHRDLPGIDGVILTVDADYAGWIIVSDSGPRGDQLEDLHATLGAGPSIDATVTGEPVAVPDVGHSAGRTRWPRFAEQAPAHGIRAVFAFPVVLHGEPVAVLSAYRATAGPLSASGLERMNTYAQAAGVVLLDNLPTTGDDAAGLVLPIGAGEVQQAVGIVMEYANVDAPTALHRLRAYARRSDRPMHDVVSDVRTSRMPFDPTEMA